MVKLIWQSIARDFFAGHQQGKQEKQGIEFMIQVDSSKKRVLPVP
jgi:hypothetical protein